MFTRLAKTNLRAPLLRSAARFKSTSTVHSQSYQSTIVERSEQGRKLAETVVATTPKNKFAKEQRYEIFINKMTQLYRSERRFQAKCRRAFRKMDASLLTSTQPVKSLLSEYNKLSERGFSGDVLATSLERLDQLILARGNQPRVYADLSVPEMDQSWRMNKVAEDIKFGLSNPHANFTPAAMARVSRSLGSLKYKNSELVPLWLNKIE